MKAKRIVIVSCASRCYSSRSYWYANRIGEEFYVVDSDTGNYECVGVNNGRLSTDGCLIDPDDCKVLYKCDLDVECKIVEKREKRLVVYKDIGDNNKYHISNYRYSTVEEFNEQLVFNYKFVQFVEGSEGDY